MIRTATLGASGYVGGELLRLRERITYESVGSGMIPKLKGCADVVEQGRARIIDGRVAHSLLIELLTDRGVGTMIRKEKSW